MIKRIPIFEDLPIEEGKIYKTRFATGDLFLVEKIIKVKTYSNLPEKIIRFDGLYVGKEHIGICPLAVDRLIPEHKLVGSKIVCDDPDYDLTGLFEKAFEMGNLKEFLNTIK